MNLVYFTKNEKSISLKRETVLPKSIFRYTCQASDRVGTTVYFLNLKVFHRHHIIFCKIVLRKKKIVTLSMYQKHKFSVTSNFNWCPTRKWSITHDLQCLYSRQTHNKYITWPLMLMIRKCWHRLMTYQTNLNSFKPYRYLCIKLENTNEWEQIGTNEIARLVVMRVYLFD